MVRFSKIPVFGGAASVSNITPTHSAESFRVAALLSVTGGFLDAYTYVARDGVFANAQTGKDRKSVV